MQMKDYRTGMTDRQFHVGIIALVCLLSPSVESGLNHATVTSTSVASTWRQSSRTSGLATPMASGPTAAFIPSQRHGNDAIVRKVGSFGRLAFLSRSVHHSHADSRSSRNMLHPRTASCAVRCHRPSILFSSNNRDDGSDNSNEEFSIQSLYQQVQEEDPEWFYQTFSKLLDEDPTERIGAPREGVVTIEAKGNVDDASGVKKIDFDDGDVAVTADDILSNQIDKRNAVETEPISLKDAISSVPGEKVELQTSLINNERKYPAIIPPLRKTTGEEDDHTLQVTIQRARASDDSIRYDGNNIREEYEGGDNDDGQYEDLDAYDEDDGNADRTSRPPQRRQPPVSESQERPRVNKPQTKPSSNATPPRVVRLRNTYTGDIEYLGSLADLMNMGYTEREIIVLRPQVLDLILEDRIPKPNKGLPKRWVRLSKLDGYKNESIDEDEDEDFEWEVEVVAGKALDEKIGLDGLDAIESVVVRNDSIDVDKSSPVEIKPDSITKKESTSAVSIPRVNERTAQQQKKSRVGESWGPFTSSRVPDTDDDNVRYKPITESGTKKKMQPPIKVEENDDSNSRRYDGYERESTHKRRPKMQGRPDDVYDVDGDSQSFSYKSKPNRSLENQQRRQRQRPPARRRELLIDRGEDDEPAPNKFWMDLPTFRDFLRKEAQFRLQILGPDWKESVLDESRWRYDLYKTWLTMLDEGIGENPLYEYGDRPDRRRSSPRPRSRGDRRRSKGSSERELPERGFDDGKRRKTRPDIRGEGGREGRRKVDSRPSLDRRPPPRGGSGTWKNFSDLEESLQRSSQERSERSSPREDKASVEDDYDEFNDEDDGDEPRSKRRSSGRPRWEGAKGGSDPSYDREYVRSYEGEMQDSPRRRRRVRYDQDTSQAQSSRKFDKSSEHDHDEPLEE